MIHILYPAYNQILLLTNVLGTASTWGMGIAQQKSIYLQIKKFGLKKSLISTLYILSSFPCQTKKKTNHRSSCFSAESMDKIAGNVWVVGSSMKYPDRSHTWSGGVKKFSYHRWGGWLEEGK